jgi:hypothetical protein
MEPHKTGESYPSNPQDWDESRDSVDGQWRNERNRY